MRRSLLAMLALTACGVVVPPNPGAVAEKTEAAVVEPAALTAAIAAGVRPRGQNEASFEVDAFVAALAVEELAAGTGGLKLEPAIEGGSQIGYRVLSVAEGSAYARIGLQAGDVVEAIGEVKLDSPGRAAGALASSQRGASVAVIRSGVGFTIELRVAGGLAWRELLRSRSGSPQGQVPEDRPPEVAVIDEIAPPPEPEEPRPVATGKPSRPSSAPLPGVQRPGSAAPSSSSSGSAGASGSAVAACSTAASCTIDRRTFDAAVADPGKLSSQVSIAPARGGYKLTRVAPNSAISQLGFRAGDTLISVNGSRLDDDAAALGLYMGLGSASKYVVVYERGGVRATKTIALRG